MNKNIKTHSIQGQTAQIRDRVLNAQFTKGMLNAFKS
jgi:hypothetical protein